ncbi:hypothetical protein [Microbacterium sp.]|uniref:arylmalonate decarboxylase n=1 Tax=Microbacterium sp. TaxID=51671 RepID=UPI0033412EDE
MTDACIGLIVPPRAGEVPRDAAEVYPDVDFLAEGLGLQEMSVAGYDSVISAVQGASERLRDRGAEAVALMGTSLSFYRGKEFNDEILQTIRNATGLPATTMSAAIVEALRAVGVTRPAVASAYTDAVHAKLLRFLGEEGFEPAGSAHLSISSIDEVHEVDDETVHRLGLEAASRSEGFDGVLISCGGLRTARAVTALEDAYGLPAVSSPLAGLWGAVRLVRPDLVGTHRSRLFHPVLA